MGVTGDTTWLQLQAFFCDALNRPREERGEILRSAAARDTRYGPALARLLQAHDASESILDRPVDFAPDDGGSGADDPLVGKRVGQYLVTERIGHGALGAVYRGMQEHPRRWVALKLPRFPRESPELLQRLEFEAETLGRLQHAYIAQIIEAGTFERDDGQPGAGRQPFIAMELIDGSSLTDHANGNRLTRVQRVELLMRLCEGVQHAHQRGVVHLDLKPANILVVEEKERTGPHQPKILDFGIARWLRAERVEVAETIGSAGICGTVAYMSPEQLAGDAESIGTRSDIYALGVIAFELFCGALPLAIPPALHGLEAIEFAQHAPRLSPREAAPALPLDLDRIVAKAMHREPAQRYASAAEFSADLHRFLQSEPVLARRATPLYVLTRFAQRHRALVGGAISVLVALLVGLLGFAWKAGEEARQRAAADARLKNQLRTNSQMVEWVENGLADLPGSTRLRLSLAESGLHSLLTLRSDAPAAHALSDELDYSLGYAHQRLGEVRLAMGDAEAAYEAYLDALQVRRRQAQSHADILRYRRALGVGHWKVADALIGLNRFDEADEHLRCALAIHESLRNSPGDVPVADAVYVGLAMQRLGISAERRGGSAASLGHFDRALIEFAAGVALEADNVQTLRGQARSLRGRAAALRVVGKTAAAEAALREALEVCDRLAAIRGSAGVWEQFEKAESLAWLAALLAESGRENESTGILAEATTIAEDLATADPLRTDFAVLRQRLRLEAKREKRRAK